MPSGGTDGGGGVAVRSTEGPSATLVFPRHPRRCGRVRVRLGGDPIRRPRRRVLAGRIDRLVGRAGHAPGASRSPWPWPGYGGTATRTTIARRSSAACTPTRSTCTAHAAVGCGTARSAGRTNGCFIRPMGCNPGAAKRPGGCASWSCIRRCLETRRRPIVTPSVRHRGRLEYMKSRKVQSMISTGNSPR